MSAGWWPIEAAPLDGTVVDLWIVHTTDDQPPRRLADCAWEAGEWWPPDDAFRPLSRSFWRPTHWRSIPGGP